MTPERLLGTTLLTGNINTRGGVSIPVSAINTLDRIHHLATMIYRDIP